MKTPTHEEISRLAHQLWQEAELRGGDATQNWLDAERQLTAGATQPAPGIAPAEPAKTHPVSESQSAHAAMERAALQKKEARQPKVATHTGPKLAPAESGKPLWNQPHSS
jgi:hypothetical protein